MQSESKRLGYVMQEGRKQVRKQRSVMFCVSDNLKNDLLRVYTHTQRKKNERKKIGEILLRNEKL